MSNSTTCQFEQYREFDMEELAGHSWSQWNPNNITMTSPDVPLSWKYCVLSGAYFPESVDGNSLGGRISAVIVIFLTSFLCTIFPVVASKAKWMRVPKWFYIVCRHFGSGVIFATAFVHLTDLAFQEIGGLSCVGQTGGWPDYAWCAAIMLASATFTFLLDVYCDFFAERYFNIRTSGSCGFDASTGEDLPAQKVAKAEEKTDVSVAQIDQEQIAKQSQYEFISQIGGFLVLEFGIIFHSIMIGITFGSSDDYATLYPVLVFHQSFEGIGIGSRMSAIPWPKGKRWWPWMFALAYGLTTPIAISVGIAVRLSHNNNNFNKSVVSGVMNSISSGILIYTSMVDLLARDFLFTVNRTKSLTELNLQILCLLVGAGLMSVLGKWT